MEIYWDARRKANGIAPNSLALYSAAAAINPIPKYNAVRYRAMLKQKLHHSMLSHIHNCTVKSCIAVLHYEYV
jgi:hypothetical protein